MREKSKPKKKTPSQEKEKGNVFDKILKENIREIRRPFAEELLGKPIKSIKPLPAKMQTTLEIESDDFSLVEYVDGEKEILHLEFEINLTKNMVYRVGEYHGVKQRKYELPIQHFVVNIGSIRKKIKTQLSDNEVYKGFTLIHANERPPEQYLASDFPAVVILAILGDYSDELKNRVIRSIIRRLQELISNQRELSKYLEQLLMFGRIRNLQPELKKEYRNMISINYDITKDEFYLEGKAAAEKKAAKEIKAAKEAAKAAAKEAREKDIAGIKDLLVDGHFNQKQIAAIIRVPLSLVRKVKKEMNNKK